MENTTSSSPSSWNALPLSDKLRYATVRVVCEYKNGSSGSGTAFMAGFRHGENRFIGVLITNKHVIKDAKNGFVHFHHSEIKDGYEFPKQEFRKVTFQESDWVPHSENDIDLCALPIGHYLQACKTKGNPIFAPFITDDMFALPQQMNELQSLEEIVMIGYPIGLWDEANNFPIFRKGVTATSPKVDYNKKKEFLIDAACFPGSSGSPVFIYNQGSYAANGAIVFGNRLLFLGVLYAGPQYSVSGGITVVSVPTASVPVAISQIPINIGYVIKAEKILEFKKTLLDKFNITEV